MTNLSDNSVASYTSVALLNGAANSFGFDINFSGILNVGDRFEVSPSINAARSLQRSAAIVNPRQIAAAGAGLPGAILSGDNRNALQLANLETDTLMQNGKVTFTQVYGQLVAEVGGMTNTALVSQSAQKVLLENANTSRENLAGVNLDEEAANLIKFQNSYQAAAQAASVARSLFDTLIGAVR
jgi:flagellar hook-associated protein 1